MRQQFTSEIEQSVVVLKIVREDLDNKSSADQKSSCAYTAGVTDTAAGLTDTEGNRICKPLKVGLNVLIGLCPYTYASHRNR